MVYNDEHPPQSPQTVYSTYPVSLDRALVYVCVYVGKGGNVEGVFAGET
jgi:hypothetical protein